MMKQTTSQQYIPVGGQMPDNQAHRDELVAINKLIERKFGLLLKKEKNLLRKMVLFYKMHTELKKAKTQLASVDNMYSIY